MILATYQVRRRYRLLIVCHLLLLWPTYKESLSHIMDNEASQKGDELSDDDDEEGPANVLLNSVNEKVVMASNKSVLKLSITFSH
jgi:hypothetical protein